MRAAFYEPVKEVRVSDENVNKKISSDEVCGAGDQPAPLLAAIDARCATAPGRCRIRLIDVPFFGRILGMSLDRCGAILSRSPTGLDPLQLSVQVQVMRVILMIGIRTLLDGRLGREASRARSVLA